MANVKSIEASEQFSMQLNASELTAIILKGSPNSNDRDAGFCSGGSEGGDDLSVDHSRLEPSSPSTDASEDSVEVKMTPIALVRNKRKSCEPSKVVCDRDQSSVCPAAGPLKKRIRYTSSADSALVPTPPAATPTPIPSPQLWDPTSHVLPHEMMPNPAQVFIRHPGVTTLHRLPAYEMMAEQEEPLALVLKKPVIKEEPITPEVTPKKSSPAAKSERSSCTPKKANKSKSLDTSDKLKSPVITLEPQRPLPASSVASTISEDMAKMAPGSSNGSTSSSSARPQQRNYKNMTRERRIEANARERTRVHTISAAYETLRRAVPSYSNAQKLSKLSVLRVACSYILTLSRMAGEDYSEDQSEPSIASCFDAVTATIQNEGKIRKKKDEADDQ